MRVDTLEDVDEIHIGIDVVQDTGRDQALCPADFLGAHLGPTEEPVLPPHRNRAERSLEVVRVDGHLGVRQENLESLLSMECVVRRLRERVRWKQSRLGHLLLQPLEELSHDQFAPAAPLFLFRLGSRGSEAGEFLEPAGVAVDSADRIIVADSGNHRVQVFDSAGEFLFRLGSQGREDGQLGSPRGVAVDSVGRIIVADTGNARVQVFDSAGKFLFRFGSQGREDGQFSLPESVAVGSADRIIVGDNSRMFGSSSMLDLLGPGFLSPAPECAEASRIEAPAPPPVAHSWRRPSFT